MSKMKVKDFNLEYTLECGQIFRINRKNNWYYVNARDKFFKISQVKNEIEFHGVDEEFIIHFFSLDENLSKILKEINKDEYIKKSIDKYRGLRILRQDPWECLISFICSTASNILELNQNLKHFPRVLARKYRWTELVIMHFQNQVTLITTIKL